MRKPRSKTAKTGTRIQVIQKPSVFEAVQWKGTVESYNELRDLLGDQVRVETSMSDLKLKIGPAWVRVPVDNWIVKRTDGAVAYCSHEMFEAHFEPVKEDGEDQQAGEEEQ